MRSTLSIQLLTLLRESRGLLVPETTLRLDLRVRVSPSPTTTELASAFTQVEQHGWALCLRDELTQEIKWRITEVGLAVLAERNL